MDRITPMELERMDLPTAFRGYDRDSVRHVLRMAAKEIEWLLNEVKETKREITKVYEDLELYKSQERALQESLKLAHKAAEDTRNLAQREAKVTLEHAQREAESMLDRALAETKDARMELRKAEMQRSEFEETFRLMLEEHLRRLDNAEEGVALVETNNEEVEAQLASG